jgi:hypothetical protein
MTMIAGDDNVDVMESSSDDGGARSVAGSTGSCVYDVMLAGIP